MLPGSGRSDNLRRGGTCRSSKGQRHGLLGLPLRAGRVGLLYQRAFAVFDLQIITPNISNVIRRNCVISTPLCGERTY